MKRIFGMIGIVVVCSLVLVGCGGKSNAKDDSANKNEPKSDLVVGGSTSIQPLMEQIAESYNKAGEGTITVQGGGSGVGTKGATDGTFDVGMASRDLEGSEVDALDGTEIALDGIVIIVNKDNPVKELSLEQAKQIYTGEITNWKDVGGNDQEIAVVSREEGSGTRDGFESIVGFETDQLVANADIQNATGAVTTSVSGNAQAIGYISMGSVSEEVNVLSVEGVDASVETVKDGSYKLQRPFILCVKKDSNAGDKLYDFIFSDEGKKLIEDHKYIPVDRAE